MPRLSIFVACPYQLFPLEDYKKSFERVGKAYDVSFKFADEQFTNLHVLNKIANYIREADISLFDITGWNPNVALELGIAVGLNRKYFILLNTKIETKDAPTDIKGIDRIQYVSNTELEARIALLITQQLPKDTRTDSAYDALKNKISNYLELNPKKTALEIISAIPEEKVLLQTTIRSMVSSGELEAVGQTKGTRYSVAS